MIKQFSDFELFQMFQVECNPDADQKETRVPHIEDGMAFNDIKVPLWVNRQRKPSKRERHYEDMIRDGITNHPAGSKGRVDDLATYYAEHMEDEVSAFHV